MGPEPGAVGVGSLGCFPTGSEPSSREESRQVSTARPHLARGAAGARAIATTIPGPAHSGHSPRHGPGSAPARPRLGSSAGPAPRPADPLRIQCGGGLGAGLAVGAGRCASLSSRQCRVSGSRVPRSSAKERDHPSRTVRPHRTGLSSVVSTTNASQPEIPPPTQAAAGGTVLPAPRRGQPLKGKA